MSQVSGPDELLANVTADQVAESVHYLTFPFAAPSIEECHTAAKRLESLAAANAALADIKQCHGSPQGCYICQHHRETK